MLESIGRLKEGKKIRQLESLTHNKRLEEWLLSQKTSGDLDMSRNMKVNVDVNTETWRDFIYFTAESRDVAPKHLFTDLDATWLK